MPTNSQIDHGHSYDWSRASEDYAKYRDIYPPAFYQKITGLGLCAPGQEVLDLGTGTGVLPRNLYHTGARFTGSDIAENQIAHARALSEEAGMQIQYLVSPAEELPLAENSFDVVTACQCFFYFDRAKVLPLIARLLRPGGKLALFFMAWLPGESEIARRSEELVLRFNPAWTGGGMTRQPLGFPQEAQGLFQVEAQGMYDLDIPFTRESWNGRIRACRGIGASCLPQAQIAAFDREHQELLARIAPAAFTIPHSVSYLVMRVVK